MNIFTPAAGNHTSTSLEFQPLKLPPGDLLLRPLGAFEELFCLFDQHFPTNGALAAQITGHTTVQQWRNALDAVQQRHPLLSACIDTTFNRVPHFRRVIGHEGVQIGTAFLPCAGSGASEAYRTALSLFAANGTDLTDAFTGRLARGIKNRLMNEFRHVSSPPLPFYRRTRLYDSSDRGSRNALF